MKRALVLGVATVALTLGPAVAASAHPLGNFTVNHYDGLTISSTHIDDRAIVDAAEIPTAQAKPSIDTNADGALGPAERSAYAARSCAAVAAAVRIDVSGRALTWRVQSSAYVLRPGAAGLSTGRLTCQLTAPVALSDGARVVHVADGYRADRVGWHEITATADGVHLQRSPVPARSVSDELLHYPNDLLSSPLDVRSATIDVRPGTGLSTFATGLAKVPGAGPVARIVERINSLFANLAGARHLTLGVGLLAVLVSMLLGASHAALPGHGKTVMAAYLAGKRGSVRDAVVVGATVTVTHTAGVLLLGLALTVSSSLAGDAVERDLGVVSGLLVAAVGVGLLVSAVRRARGSAADDHGHQHGHDHGHDHAHGHAHDHSHDGENAEPHRQRRAGLVGMGIAGGLVPSPSALVVLLGAVALGRTLFGALLVVTYGLGMAATLTAAGLLLVRLSSRWPGRRIAGLVAVRLTDRWSPWLARRRLAQRLSGATPLVTAGLVVVVGLGLAARSIAVL
jgi:nickel/cobalt exporter